jgi:hypothetical protein
LWEEIIKRIRSTSLYIKDEKPKMVFTLSHEDPMKMAEDQYGISYDGQSSWDDTL